MPDDVDMAAKVEALQRQVLLQAHENARLRGALADIADASMGGSTAETLVRMQQRAAAALAGAV